MKMKKIILTSCFLLSIVGFGFAWSLDEVVVKILEGQEANVLLLGKNNTGKIYSEKLKKSFYSHNLAKDKLSFFSNFSEITMDEFATFSNWKFVLWKREKTYYRNDADPNCDKPDIYKCELTRLYMGLM